MNEISKSAILAALAAALALTTWLTTPADFTPPPAAGEGAPLMPEFTTPAIAANLEIVFPEERTTLTAGQEITDVSAALGRFELTRETNGWKIASHDRYPATALGRLEAAITNLAAAKTGRAATDQASDYANLGVASPTAETVASGAAGVGRLVKVRDAQGKLLGQLIIGKPVEGSPGQRFVRRPDQRRVYTAGISLDFFSTNFADWVNPGLLPISSADVERLTVRDYSARQRIREVDGQPQLYLADRAQATITRAPPQPEGAENSGADQGLLASAPKAWDLTSLQVARSGQYVPATLASVEELDQDRVERVLEALVAIHIQDVERLPAGEADDFSAAAAQRREDLRQALTARGFFLDGRDGEPTLLAAGGELSALLANGVAVTLFFGEAQGFATASEGAQLQRFVRIGVEPSPSANDAEAAEHAREAAAALREMFAPWIFVIDEETYRELRPNRAELIRQRPNAAETGFGLDAFRKLQQEGLRRGKDGR